MLSKILCIILISSLINNLKIDVKSQRYTKFLKETPSCLSADGSSFNPNCKGETERVMLEGNYEAIIERKRVNHENFSIVKILKDGKPVNKDGKNLVKQYKYICNIISTPYKGKMIICVKENCNPIDIIMPKPETTTDPCVNVYVEVNNFVKDLLEVTNYVPNQVKDATKCIEKQFIEKKKEIEIQEMCKKDAMSSNNVDKIISDIQKFRDEQKKQGLTETKTAKGYKYNQKSKVVTK